MTVIHKRSNLVIQAVLSIWVVFHLFSVLVSPNRSTYLGSRLSAWVGPYANFFELAANWGFFAPQPGPPIRLEFEAISGEGVQIARGYWPELSSPWRQTALSHFIMMQQGGGDRLIGNFLCHRNPGSRSVRLWRNVYRIPTLDEVAEGKKRIGDDTQFVRHFMGESTCPKEANSGAVSTLTAGVNG